jgi:hypothetical protein
MLGEHRRHRMDYAMMDDGGGRPGPDGDHRWCREHHAWHGDHRERVVLERVRIEPRPVPVVMAARVSRVVGCRCSPPRHRIAAAPHRQVAQRVRRAGERG